MTERERYIETILFGKPDKVFFAPGYPRESTLKVWHEQGLPEGADYYSALMSDLGIKYEPVKDRIDLGVLFKMIPEFEEKVLEHKDGHYIIQDWMGAITEISDKYDYTYSKRRWIYS